MAFGCCAGLVRSSQSKCSSSSDDARRAPLTGPGARRGRECRVETQGRVGLILRGEIRLALPLGTSHFMWDESRAGQPKTRHSPRDSSPPRGGKTRKTEAHQQFDTQLRNQNDKTSVFRFFVSSESPQSTEFRLGSVNDRMKLSWTRLPIWLRDPLFSSSAPLMGCHSLRKTKRREGSLEPSRQFSAQTNDQPDSNCESRLTSGLAA